MCESIENYNSVLAKLNEENCQFFSHDLISARHFKVVLYGLDDVEVNSLKAELIKLGLKCIDIKKISKKYDHYIDTIYLISLENGSIKLNDLKKKLSFNFAHASQLEHST